MPQEEEPEVHRRGPRHEVDEHMRLRVRLHTDWELVREVPDGLRGFIAKQQVRIVPAVEPVAEMAHKVATLVSGRAEPREVASSRTASRSMTRSIIRP